MKVGRQALHLNKVTVDYIHNMDMKMQAETAAKDAATEAAVIATESMNMPTTPAPLNLPTIPPIGGPAFAAAVGIPPAPAPLPPAPPAAAPGAPRCQQQARLSNRAQHYPNPDTLLEW